ncbi:MAG TPA: hypothetical protein VKT81_22185 [Bryobacteraceae bacterium]|nr:hypothetical protein [Bryobacteraceae bacterium]
MTTNAIPGFDGKCFKKAVKASNPPAEAPTPTIGNDWLRVGKGRLFRLFDSTFCLGAGFDDFGGLDVFFLIRISCRAGTGDLP